MLLLPRNILGVARYIIRHRFLEVKPFEEEKQGAQDHRGAGPPFGKRTPDDRPLYVVYRLWSLVRSPILACLRYGDDKPGRVNLPEHALVFGRGWFGPAQRLCQAQTEATVGLNLL
jgi:hypothetical protein